MKKTLKVLLSILFVGIVIFSIYRMIISYQDYKLILVAVSIVIFLCFLVSWLFPKTFFKLCWKIAGSITDDFDYDTNFNKLDVVGFGLLIVANILASISLI